ncbi:unnamed protein product, partial [Nippostrongylus brasiliensis]|uniref:Uncharacterized protein n=1 Tax=Nippostrongylus brasiliensis TaxID=27835 RepID=A0A0N4XKV8_NIPBR
MLFLNSKQLAAPAAAGGGVQALGDILRPPSATGFGSERITPLPPPDPS